MSKIITIKGTSGSGKSHLVRAIMALFPTQLPQLVEGRKRPLYYLLSKPGVTELAVLGHYETACGGCDTISECDVVTNQAAYHADNGRNVLYEGLLLAVDVKRIGKLAETHEAHAIILNTPLQVCLDSINARRAARGKLEPVNPDNTASKHGALLRLPARFKHEAPKVNVHVLNRDEAFLTVKQLLGIPA